MYESIIWVSFAVSAFGLIFFLRYRTLVYLLAALPATALALLLVHQMPIAMPASIDPLVPVLRDNFWLTIHVLTITLSYAAFLLDVLAQTTQHVVVMQDGARYHTSKAMQQFFATLDAPGDFLPVRFSWSFSHGKVHPSRPKVRRRRAAQCAE